MTTTVHLTSVQDYLAAVLAFSREQTHDVVFRGQRNDWPLHPRVIRDEDQGGLLTMPDCLRREWHTYGLFRIHGANLIPPQIAMGSDARAAWITLMLMQHHRVPTRLLDWTQSPLTALFFALEHPPEDGETPSVYGKLIETIYPVEQLTKKGFAAPPELFGQDHASDDGDLFVIPPRIDRRMEAQSGLFSVSLDPSTPVPLEIRWTLEPAQRGAMLRDLEALGVNHFQQFPDLEGLGNWLGAGRWM